MVRLSDTHWISEALRLAKKSEGKTLPNPAVGAIVVKGGRVIARGFHRRAGLPHAEIEALQRAGTSARDATLYVTLEPCNHFGKTPPCADAIIKAGISRVVASIRDPNASVTGGGIAKLRRAGIAVSVGNGDTEARKLNEQFFTFHEKKRPFVALKFAASLDGKLATYTGDSKWITNGEARAFARNLRGMYQGILVGVGTVVADNPHLGVRDKKMHDPLRIILDPSLRSPLSSKVFRDGHVLVAALSNAPARRKRMFEKHGIPLVLFKGARISIKGLLKELKERNIISVLVEGGGETLGGFIDAHAADTVCAFLAPVIIGGKSAVAVGGRGAHFVRDALRLKNTAVRTFGDTLLVSGTIDS